MPPTASLLRVTADAAGSLVPTCPPAIIACIYVGMSDKDNAFAWPEKTYAERDRRLDEVQVDPRFDTLREDPRFAKLLRRVHFPPSPAPAPPAR